MRGNPEIGTPGTTAFQGLPRFLLPWAVGLSSVSGFTGVRAELSQSWLLLSTDSSLK